jgi:SAM-dependent methyltransferase
VFLRHRVVRRSTSIGARAQAIAELMSSYDVAADFGTLYDSAPVYAVRPDIAFYVEEANRVGEGSMVLELGSGTGRLTLPLARAGHPVIGLDLSPAMLTRARAKLAAMLIAPLKLTAHRSPPSARRWADLMAAKE